MEVMIARKKKQLTQAQLSEQVGISRAYLSKIENGYDDCVTKCVMIKLSKALDTPIEKLFFSEVANKLWNGDVVEILIRIFKENDKNMVSGRELHDALGIKTRYNDWFNRMLEYGFIDGQDFTAISKKRVTAQGNKTTYSDHAITINMAKELCMTQKNDIGKKVRRFFIERDKKLEAIENDIRRQINSGSINGVQGKEFKLYRHAYIDELMYKNAILGGKEAYELGNIIYECGIEIGKTLKR